eukprot:s5902_g1.t1
MTFKWSGLSEEQQAVVKGRALGVMKLDTISQAMRSVYPDFICKRRTGVALVEEDEIDTSAPSALDTDEVQGFDDIELFLADHLPPVAEVSEAFDEPEIAEVLAATWKEKRMEISKLQRQRRFADAKDVKKSFRVEIEELKRKSRCNRCGRIGHWARECRQKRDPTAKSTSSSGPALASTSVATGKEAGVSMVVPVGPHETDDDEIHGC